MRLNRYISESGVCSRRAADRIIEEGRVTLDGRIAVLGDRVAEGQTVCVDGRTVQPEEEDIILVFNKPRGITCTSSPEDGTNVIDFIGYPKRIYTVGRLDKDSEGLLLLTNNGDLANRLIRARYGHEKEYLVTVDRPVTGGFLKGMASGVPVLGKVTRECLVERTDEHGFRIVLEQGLNRQIRRMCEHFGYSVTRLVRVRVANVELGDLGEGRYRRMSRAEKEALMGRSGPE
jgi:23S rRNA pseudouridine2604 synthase